MQQAYAYALGPSESIEQIQYLPGHLLGTSIWGLEVSQDGAFAISCGQDRSIRVWNRSDDLVFIEEEKDRALEAEVDRSGASGAINGADPDGYNESGTIAVVSGQGDVNTLKGGERLLEAIELVENELMDIQEYEMSLSSRTKTTPRVPNRLLLGLHPLKYLLRILREIKAPDLEAALLLIPFANVCRLITLLLKMCRKGLDVELCTRYCIFLIHCHRAQIVSTHSLLEELSEIQRIVRNSIGGYRDLIGTNLAAVKYMRRLDRFKEDEDMMITIDGSNAEIVNKRTAVGAVLPKKIKSKNKKRKQT